MNRATLADLQRRRSYPSITLLVNTTPGTGLSPEVIDAITRLSVQLDDRLDGDVTDALRLHLMTRLRELVEEQISAPATRALALFVSLELATAVRLAHHVDERVTIDDTFTTRDLVADLNRTALFRVVAVSDRVVRLFVGDRQRLVEQRDEFWPLRRTDEHTDSTWARDVNQLLRREDASHPVPTIVAGVQRTARRLVPSLREAIGVIPGNHDRTPASELHHAAWPLVTDWLRADGSRAMRQIDDARSANRYAGGIDEIWPLAHEGRVATLVVEADYTLAARIDSNNQLHRADDPHHPDVFDDVVDDTIETVLNHGGTTVIVETGALRDHQRIAAALRY